MSNVGEGLWERAMEQGIDKGRQEVIQAMVKILRKHGVCDVEIMGQIMEEFQLDENAAKQYM